MSEPIDALLVGLSAFARRRVIPALAALPEIRAIHVASLHAPDDALAQVPRLGSVHRDHARALAGTPPALVYISTTNDLHAPLAEQAMAHGHHVVVDKPISLALADAERLVTAAAAHGRVIAEATSYPFHPLIERVKALFGAGGPHAGSMALTPPISLDDFRYRRALGGGALADLGPYAASLGRVLWGAMPLHVTAKVDTRADGIDTAFVAFLTYPGDRLLKGRFAFTESYKNHVTLAAPELEVEVPRMFSPPPEMAIEITIRRGDEASRETIAPADGLRLMLAEVLAAIDAGDGSAFAAALLADARVRAQLA